MKEFEDDSLEGEEEEDPGSESESIGTNTTTTQPTIMQQLASKEVMDKDADSGIESAPSSARPGTNKSTSASSASSAAGESVKVVVRCRPMTEKEVREGHVRVVDMDSATGVVTLSHPVVGNGSMSSSRMSSASDGSRGDKDVSGFHDKKVFTFDKVYDWNSEQTDLYNESAHPLVEAVLQGFNCTMFAYGQTGTGKTYTMEGIRDTLEQRGVIPNSFHHIFSHISQSHQQQYLVRASYLEIYQEEVRDLLCKDQTKRLEVKERPDTGVFVQDLSSFVCKSVNEIEHVMTVGNRNRSVGATNMNQHSSRSHAIFVITVEHSQLGLDDVTHIRVGKLNLVDLAGSERQVKTGTSGVRQKEAIKINLSLSALGNVISALVDGRTSHVPYRDSKLTRLLQDSLGGNSKTVMVANVGPASYNYEETLTTLRYANRAKNIRNKPRVNEDPKDALLREFQSEIERLKQLLTQKKDPSTRKNSIDETESDDPSGDDKLNARILAMQSKLLTGDRKLADDQTEAELEHKRQQIEQQRQREIEMQLMLEAEEENEVGVRGTFSSLQQQVEVKRKKLRNLFSRLQSVKGQIQEAYESNAIERRDLEQVQGQLLQQLKLKYLVIDNFVPVEEKVKLLHRAQFREETDEWVLMPASETTLSDGIDEATMARPGSGSYRPVSAYSKVASQVGPAFRYKGHNILHLDLINPPSRVTHYTAPAVSPRIQDALKSALTSDQVVNIDALSLRRGSDESDAPVPFKIVIDKKSGRPKTASSSTRSSGSSMIRSCSNDVSLTNSMTSSTSNNSITSLSHTNSGPKGHPPGGRPDTAHHFPQSRGLVQRR